MKYSTPQLKSIACMTDDATIESLATELIQCRELLGDILGTANALRELSPNYAQMMKIEAIQSMAKRYLKETEG